MRAGHDMGADRGSAEGAATTTWRIDERLVADARGLRARADRLRCRAGRDDGPLAISYRRRASELMLQAWLIELRSGLPLSQIPDAA